MYTGKCNVVSAFNKIPSTNFILNFVAMNLIKYVSLVHQFEGCLHLCKWSWIYIHCITCKFHW